MRHLTFHADSRGMIPASSHVRPTQPNREPPTFARGKWPRVPRLRVGLVVSSVSRPRGGACEATNAAHGAGPSPPTPHLARATGTQHQAGLPAQTVLPRPPSRRNSAVALWVWHRSYGGASAVESAFGPRRDASPRFPFQPRRWSSSSGGAPCAGQHSHALRRERKRPGEVPGLCENRSRGQDQVVAEYSRAASMFLRR